MNNNTETREKRFYNKEDSTFPPLVEGQTHWSVGEVDYYPEETEKPDTKDDSREIRNRQLKS
ncbi:MAG TPA: hypothetical protein VNI84_18945 [Pyrinomonadaceae bacterium]|nr:hypothetical protein [Pyrinomonadaceae bacterium]